MSKGIWILIFIIIAMAMIAILFLGSGLFSPKGKFTKTEFEQQGGVSLNVTRDIMAASPVPGDNITIMLNVALGNAEWYLIDEYLPPGWELINRGDSINSTSDNRHVLRISNQGASGSPSHSYVVRVPATVTGRYDFNGTYTFGRGTRDNAIMVDESAPGVNLIITGENNLTFQDGRLDISTAPSSAISINGNVIGTGNVLQTLPASAYTIGFAAIPGYVIKPLTAAVNPGKIKTIRCNYLPRDPADRNDDGIIMPNELTNAIDWFLYNRPDPDGKTYGIYAASLSIVRFYKSNYFSQAAQCTITESDIS
ncbi:MAG: hypothetical protein HZB65_03560 [Candidatus Aenigmarchaeota archaeon]|nr:hypothetical protein [Candidatus Aenigmarchaeota archaeon]